MLVGGQSHPFQCRTQGTPRFPWRPGLEHRVWVLLLGLILTFLLC